MNKNDRINKIKELLVRDYPEVVTPLLHQSAFQLLVATMLSAQTLDETVNKISPQLFSKYPTADKLAQANVLEVNKMIVRVNYHNTKARNVVAMAKKLIDEFGGIVPYKIEELIKLPGVGRKTANVVISEWFAKPVDKRGNPIILSKIDDVITLPEGFVVDTHVLRTTKRLGLTKNSTAEKVEHDLMKIFSREEWNDMSLRLIFHGRYMCKAKNPLCYLDPEWSKICRCVDEKK